jgi:hypothetical protein
MTGASLSLKAPAEQLRSQASTGNAEVLGDAEATESDSKDGFFIDEIPNLPNYTA